MEDSDNIRLLLEKYVEGKCSAEEIAEVIAYFKSEGNHDEFPDVSFVTSTSGAVPRLDAGKNELIFRQVLAEAGTIERRRAKRRSHRKYMVIAATLLIVISCGSVFLKNYLLPVGTIPEAANEITLELGDGKVRVIETASSGQVRNASGKVVGQQENNRISYSEKKSNTGETVYNTIRVPYGKRFDVKLSDGTVVYLNSGTSLKYPEYFPERGKRKVELTGEAFFEVAEDKERPFIVHTEGVNVKVFGTRFNVMAYPEDNLADVVLVEGSVGMYEGRYVEEQATILTPGHKGSFSKSDKETDVSLVETSVYTSWIAGGLVFRHMTFENMMKKLERQYGVQITIKNKTLAGEEFSASFEREPIEEVLEYFRITYGVRYETEGQHIIIN
ncbi:FecR family protein [Sinomicrobium oceani]|uniref:FecR family protein n=1 Tax=Sinomicrobium oceani TaxID=1150368 RepID=UPI00227B5827|nr:FecR domain-containing protein [Sinomicrobium oceani]